jgi:hypothetical protein
MIKSSILKGKQFLKELNNVKCSINLAVSNYDTSTLIIYKIEDGHPLRKETDFNSILHKLGHNPTNCEWFVFDKLEQISINNQ